MLRWIMAAVLACGSQVAQAQADVGLVNLVSGEVRFMPLRGAPGRAKVFMKAREGDRFEVPAGAQIRVLFFDGSRQERWEGPASFRTDRARSSAIKGAVADAQVLPSSVPARLARVPDLVRNARLGGIQVRGLATPRPASEEALQEARSTYEALRAQLPGDDITPELFLYAALHDNQLYDEMAPLTEEMRRKQPDNEDVSKLAEWVKMRQNR